MKTYAKIGIILIAVGILAFAFQGITLAIGGPAVTEGTMYMAAGMMGMLPIPPVVGSVALIIGIALLFSGSRNYEEQSKRQRLNRRWLR